MKLILDQYHFPISWTCNWKTSLVHITHKMHYVRSLVVDPDSHVIDTLYSYSPVSIISTFITNFLWYIYAISFYVFSKLLFSNVRAKTNWAEMAYVSWLPLEWWGDDHVYHSLCFFCISSLLMRLFT